MAPSWHDLTQMEWRYADDQTPPVLPHGVSGRSLYICTEEAAVRVLSTAGDEAKSAALQLSPKQHGEVAECMERLLGEMVERAKRPAAAR